MDHFIENEDKPTPTLWERIFGFFKRSETIVWARLQAAVGFLVAVAGGLDWAPLVGLVSAGGFTRGQVIGLAITLFLQGLFTEWLRRLRAPNLGEPQ